MHIIVSVTISLGHAPVHFTSLHHKINYNSQVHTHCCGRYFTVVDDFIKQFLCREGLGKFFLVQQTYKITTLVKLILQMPRYLLYQICIFIVTFSSMTFSLSQHYWICTCAVLRRPTVIFFCWKLMIFRTYLEIPYYSEFSINYMIQGTILK